MYDTDVYWASRINPYASEVIGEGKHWGRMKAEIKYLYDGKQLDDQVMPVQADRCSTAL